MKKKLLSVVFYYSMNFLAWGQPHIQFTKLICQDSSVAYRALENPFLLVGFSDMTDSLSIQAALGQVYKTKAGFYYKCGTNSSSTDTLYVLKNGNNIYSQQVSIRRLSDPSITLVGKKEGSLRKDELFLAPYFIVCYDHLLNMYDKVSSFHATLWFGRDSSEFYVNGNVFTQEILNRIRYYRGTVKAQFEIRFRGALSCPRMTSLAYRFY